MKTKLAFFSLIFLSVHFLQAQQLALPEKIDFFRYSVPVSYHLYGFPDTRIWGWSNNGKVAYSIESEDIAKGGQTIEFVIIDIISDMVVFELKIDSFDHGEVEGETLYNLFGVSISNALQENGIVRQRTDFLRFPIIKNDTVYTCEIIDREYRRDNYNFFDNNVSKYKVTVTANCRRKIINEFIPVNEITRNIYVCGYILSPYENRALVVIAEEYWGFEGTELTFRFSGCHLGIGFN
jgi:hypothetical protein